MTVLAFDGFEMYGSVSGVGGMGALWTVAGNTSGTFPAGRWGGKCLQWSNPSSTAVNTRRDLGADYTALAFGFSLYADGIETDWGVVGAGEPLFQLQDSAFAAQLSLYLDITGNLIVYRGTTTVIATGNGNRKISRSGSHYVQIETTIDDTTGTVKVWIDDVQIINASGLDTKATAVAGARYFAWAISNGMDTICQVDDWYATDGARLGERRVVAHLPTADTAVKDWVPNSGTANFSRVNEATFDTDTTYVQGSTVGNADFYDIADLPSTITLVEAVGLFVYGRKTDVAAREIQGKIKSNTDVVATPGLVLTSTYTLAYKLQTSDPQGGGAWTPTRVNALQIGQEVTV